MHRLTIARTFALAALSALALFVTPVGASAQERAVSASSIGPVIAPVGVVRADAESDSRTLHIQNAGPNNRNVIWMIVGGGMLVGGSIIGDDVGTIISVTGLVIGLVGLFRFLQ